MSTPIVAVGGITLPAMRPSGTPMVGAIRDAVRQLRDSSLDESETPAGRGIPGRIRRDTTDTGILAAKVGTTARMGKVSPPARAGAKWRVVTIIASPTGVAVEHERVHPAPVRMPV